MWPEQYEEPRLQADLGRANHFVLRNHGLLTVGRSMACAFLSMCTLENTCRIQIDALAGGTALIHVNPAAYLVPVASFEAMMERIGDQSLAEVAKARRDGPSIEVGEQTVTVTVVAVGQREDNAAYNTALERLG